MPSPDALVADLGAIANDWRGLAITWHLLFAGLFLALIAGWRPLDFLAVEANYIDMGGDSDSGTSIDSSAISVSALLLAEVGIVDLYARAGMAMWDTEFTDLGDSVSDDGWEPTYGVGVGVHFGSLGVRAEYEYLKAEPFDNEIDGLETKYSTITLSVTYTFL